jgi:hypothetical protein
MMKGVRHYLVSSIKVEKIGTSSTPNGENVKWYYDAKLSAI